jgi:hypothetical protein
MVEQKSEILPRLCEFLASSFDRCLCGKKTTAVRFVPAAPMSPLIGPNTRHPTPDLANPDRPQCDQSATI